MEDGALLSQARAGDARAFERLVRRHEAALQARIRRLLPPRLLRRLAVSDILQETRITAHDKMGEFEQRGEDSFRHWLLAIAERKARRAVQAHVGVHMRSLQREVTQGQRLPTGQFLGGWPTASEVVMAEETADLARRALEALAEDDQTILRLCREEGLAFREAAERMGRSYEATKKLYGRALARFAVSLQRLKRGE
jgi:RNA polymerase sigma factor (sigma-70 family)